MGSNISLTDAFIFPSKLHFCLFPKLGEDSIVQQAKPASPWVAALNQGLSTEIKFEDIRGMEQEPV